jgi:hypothetical protein
VTEATAQSEATVIDPAEHGRSLRKAAMLTAGFGIAHAVLFLLSFWLARDAPGPSSSDQEYIDYYSSGDSRRLLLIGLYLMPFAGIAFVWFIVSLRMWIRGSIRRENILLSNIQLVSGIIYVALSFVAAASESVIAASVEFSEAPVDPQLARQFPQFGSAILFVFAMRMAAMFVITTSNMGRGSGILPNWFAYGGFLVGLFLLLSATFNPALVFVFPVWLLLLALLLLRKARQIPAELRVPAQLPQPPAFFPPGHDDV